MACEGGSQMRTRGEHGTLNWEILSASECRMFVLPTPLFETGKIKIYKTVILTAGFYVLGIWFRVERTLKVQYLEKWKLRIIFGSKTEEMLRGSRK